MLHNFFHHIFKKTKENEIDFDAKRFEYFLNNFLYNPNEWIQSIFSYFGHFGVQIFIFLSAYALTLTYPQGGVKFFFSRIKKLYPLFLAAIILWLCIDIISATALSNQSIDSSIDRLIKRVTQVTPILLGYSPFISGSGYPVVGPWWFIPYIMQFYLVWAIFSQSITKLSKAQLLILLASSVIFSYIAIPLFYATTKIYILLTVFGHLPEIIFAVFCAKYGTPSKKTLLLIGIPLLVGSSLNLWLYPFHHLAGLFVFLPIALMVATHNGKLASITLLWLGQYSLALFLVNGYLRKIPIELSRYLDSFWGDYLSAILFLLIAGLAAVFIDRMTTTITDFSRKKFKSNNKVLNLQ